LPRQLYIRLSLKVMLNTLTRVLTFTSHEMSMIDNYYLIYLQAKDRSAGTEIDGRRIRVDYSITERAHTPTPGIYLGKPTT
jgi:hypothetical protein